jgi:drug/metabolite transporter (DMT)-like permease
MLKTYLKLHFVVAILAFTAILGKLISGSFYSIVLYRTLIASLALLAIILFRKKTIAIGKPAIIKLLGVGFLLGAHWICFFGSAKISTVSISLIAFSTTSFFTSIFEPLINKTKFQKSDLALSILTIIGMAIIFSFETKYLNGILFGILGAILAAIFSILNSKLTNKYDSQVISFYELGSACLLVAVIVLVNLFYTGFDFKIISISTLDLVWIIVLAIGCTVYPYVEMLNLYKKISVFTINLSLNLEPVYGIILAYLFFKQSEIMTKEFYIGGFLVFIPVVLQSYIDKKKSPADEKA